MEHQPHEDSLPSGQCEQQRNDEVNFAAKGLAHNPPKDRQNKKTAHIRYQQASYEKSTAMGNIIQKRTRQQTTGKKD